MNTTKNVNFHIVLELLQEMDILHTGGTPWLCWCLDIAWPRVTLENTKTKREHQWINIKIQQAIHNHTLAGNALKEAKGMNHDDPLPFEEGYHFRKFLIQRFIGEATLYLNQNTNNTPS